MWHLPAGSVALYWESSEKSQWPLLTLLSGKKLSSALASLTDTSVPPFIPQVPFNLLPWCQSSEGVCLHKSVCRFLKRKCLGLQKFLLLTQALLFFCSQKIWALIFLPLEHWTGWPCLGLGFVAPEIPSQIFIHHMWVWDQPVPCLCPSYQSGWVQLL